MGVPVPEPARPGPHLSAEQFAAWKASKQAHRAFQTPEERERDIREGRVPVEQMTGRELAKHCPEVFDGY